MGWDGSGNLANRGLDLRIGRVDPVALGHQIDQVGDRGVGGARVVELSAEERLLRAIFNEKSREVRDTSLKVPHGEEGTVIAVKEFNAEEGDDELGSGVNQRVVVYIAQKRKITLIGIETPIP